jgi:hypothetical protein
MTTQMKKVTVIIYSEAFKEKLFEDTVQTVSLLKVPKKE